jgi:hypothetical protein
MARQAHDADEPDLAPTRSPDLEFALVEAETGSPILKYISDYL